MIDIRKHEFPKHYKIPADPYEESVFNLIRPVNDKPEPLFKSKFSKTVKDEKQKSILNAALQKKKGKLISSLQSPTISIMVGNDYEIKNAVSNTLNKSFTGLHLTTTPSVKSKVSTPTKKVERFDKILKKNKIARAAEKSTLIKTPNIKREKKNLTKNFTMDNYKINNNVVEDSVPEDIVQEETFDKHFNLEVPEEIIVQDTHEKKSGLEKTVVLAGLRKDWNDLNMEYQRFPITSMGPLSRQNRRKYLEKQLCLIEASISSIEGEL